MKNSSGSNNEAQVRDQRYKKDRRVHRTRKILMEALLKLMLEKGYEAITVQNIIDEANVGRSTFYVHFLDKQDLLQSGIDQLKEFLSEQKKNTITQHQSITNEFQLSFSLAMFQHAQDHYDLYRAMAGKESGALVQHQMKQMFIQLVEEEMAFLKSEGIETSIPIEIIIHYTVNSLMSIMTWWLDHSMPYSAEKMDGIFHNLTVPGLLSVLETE